jgi:hypothetical protein
MPRVRVPWHVTWLAVRLSVDYFGYAARPGASAHRAARRAARRRLLLQHCASGCLGTSRGLLSTTSPTLCPGASAHRAARHRQLRLVRLVVDYFTYAVHPGASARHTARCRLLHLRCASGSLGTSRGSSSTTSPCVARRRLLLHTRLIVDNCASCSSLSTTSPTSRVRVPRHVTRLVLDYFAYNAHPGAMARRATRHRLLRLHRAS